MERTDDEAGTAHIEAEILGRSPDERRAVRQDRTKSLVNDMLDSLKERLTHVPGRLKTAEVIRYALNHRDGPSRFLDDGRLELDTNTVERGIRPIALNRKNAVFAGGDEGASYCASGHLLINPADFVDDRQAAAAASGARRRGVARRRGPSRL